MKTYDVFMQLPPDSHDRAQVKHVGRLKAESGVHAIGKAKQWKKFRDAEGLARWPIVEERSNVVKRVITQPKQEVALNA
jgi:hypothetical protein